MLKELLQQVIRTVGGSIGGSIAGKSISDYVNKAVSGVKAHAGARKFSFSTLPSTLQEAALTDPYAVAALSLLALTPFEAKREESIAMLNFLKGPEPLNPSEIQQISDRFMDGKFYKVNSFFEGATPQNNYTPSKPYTVEVSVTPYSFENQGWAVMYLHSGGADNPRPLKLRQKPSTGQWFLVEIQYLGDIRVPVSADKWA